MGPGEPDWARDHLNSIYLLLSGLSLTLLKLEFKRDDVVNVIDWMNEWIVGIFCGSMHTFEDIICIYESPKKVVDGIMEAK